MPDINNKINLDASGAISALNQLNRSLTQANAVLTNFKVNADGSIDDSFGRAAAGAAQLASTTKQVGTGTQQAAGAANDLRLSWETVARVIQTQLLIRGLNELRDAFTESANAAAEFQLTIGRINAIADQSETNFNDLSERIKALSITIGRDLGETSAAVFEALQNDLGTTDETFQLLEDQASKLALVTGGTLGDAVSALSAVIKVYGEESDDAAGAAGILFGAINAGRLTLSELQGSLGTVIPLAGRLGISFEQAASAIATISLAGVDAATAQTQFRNVLNKLIKPTQELEQAFVGLRVNGFDELLERTGGDFTAALNDIAQELGNDERAIARAFNTIRGNLGVFNILTQDGRIAAETLNTVQQSAGNLNTEFEKINQLDAQQAARNSAQLGVIFTEVGENALALRNTATGAFLSIISTGEQANTALLGLGATAGLTAAAFGAMQLASVAAGSSLLLGFATPLGAAVAVMAALTAGSVLAVKGIDALNTALSDLGPEAEFQIGSLTEVVKTVQRLNTTRLDDLQRELSDSTLAANRLLSESKTTAREIVRAFEATAGPLRRAGQNALDSFSEGRERVLDSIRDQIDNLDRDIASNTRSLADATSELADLDFRQSIQGLSAQQQAAQALERSYQATAQAAQLAATAGLGEGSRQAAEDQIRAARAAADFSLQLANASGNSRQIASAQAQVRAAVQANVSLVQRQVDLQTQLSQVTLSEQLDALENVNEEQKNLIQEQVERYNDLTRQVADGVPREVLNDQFDDIRRNLESIGDSLPNFSGAEIVERFGLTQIATGVEQQLLDSLNNLDVRWDNAINGLKDQLTGTTFEANVRLNAAIDNASVSRDLTDQLAGVNTDDPTVGLEQRLSILRGFLVQQQESANAIALSGADYNLNIATARANLERAAQSGIFSGQAENAQAIAQPALDALQSIGTASATELQEIRAGLQNALEFARGESAGLFSNLAESTQVNLVAGLEAALSAAQARATVIGESARITPEGQAELDRLRNLIDTPQEVGLDVDTTGVDNARTGLNNAETAASEAATSTASIGTNASSAAGNVAGLAGNTNSVAAAAAVATQQFNAMAAAARAAAAAAASARASGGGETNLAFHGGVQYRNNGGASRGQDTIPTMLAPGEFVANQRATANFLPELQAINAGNAPGSSASGGTTITIGDINVNSQSQLPSQTAREVGNSIKRELRRGTFRL